MIVLLNHGIDRRVASNKAVTQEKYRRLSLNMLNVQRADILHHNVALLVIYSIQCGCAYAC